MVVCLLDFFCCLFVLLWCHFSKAFKESDAFREKGLVYPDDDTGLKSGKETAEMVHSNNEEAVWKKGK